MTYTYTPAETSLSGLLTQIEAAIAAIEIADDPDGVTQITALDESGGPDLRDLPSEVAVGFTLDVPTTRDADQLADEDECWLEDTITVRLLCRALPGASADGRPANWRASLRRRADIEAAIVWQLHNACPEQRIRRTSCTRAQNPAASILSSTITFTARRFEPEE